jgi:hypothetical protein
MRDRPTDALAQPADGRLLGQWVRATSLGWLLGIPLIVAFALAGEVVGIGGAQFIVGVGMGTGIGLLQGRVLRPLLGRSAPWIWSCAIGLSLPFAVVDLAGVVGRDLPFSLYWCVAIGGLAAGVWQAALLHRVARPAAAWIVASVLGWSLAGSTSAIAEGLMRSRSIRGLAGALLYLGIIAAGGVVLGFVTGLVLPRLLRKPPAAALSA